MEFQPPTGKGIFLNNHVAVNAHSTPLLGPVVEAGRAVGVGHLSAFKHVRVEHLPARGGSIRVGTVSAFRVSEDPVRADAVEGTFSVEVFFPKKTTVSRDWFNKLTSGAYSSFLDAFSSDIPVGQFSSNVIVQRYVGRFNQGVYWIVDDHFHLESIDDDSISVSGKLVFEFLSVDAFVLSLSKKSKPGSVLRDPACNSVWAIRPDRFDEFCSRIARSILAEMHRQGTSILLQPFRGPFNEPVFDLPAGVENFEPAVMHMFGKVEYREKVILVEEPSDEILSEIGRCFEFAPFIKPVLHRSEEEIRVLFRPNFVNTSTKEVYLMPFYFNPVYIPFDGVLDLVYPVASEGRLLGG